MRPRPMPNAKTVDDGEDEKNVDTSNNIIAMPWRAMVAWGPRRSVIFEEEGDVDTVSAGRVPSPVLPTKRRVPKYYCGIFRVASYGGNFKGERISVKP